MEPGQSIDTRIYFKGNAWYYIYEVKFVGKSDYDCIKEITKQENSKETYDLGGRSVSNPTKSIYIKNGKKFVLK